MRFMFLTKPTLYALATFLLLLVLPAALAAQRSASPRSRPAAKPAPSFKFTVEESPAAIVLKTDAYEVSITRDGFAVEVRRDGKTILQSAQPSDRAQNLGFELNGSAHRPAKLASFERKDGRLLLNYGTTLRDARARVEVTPATDRIHLKTWLLNNDGDLVPSLRYRLGPSGQWYGGGFQGWRDPQTFPLNQAHIAKDAFFAQGNTQVTPCWYATSGVALWVRTFADFRYSVNRKSDGRDDGLLSIEMPGVSALEYDIIVGKNIREVVDTTIREIGYPKAVPPADYFRLPIYTTWVEHKTAVSQEKVLEFARAIRQNKLPAGVIEIDDKWEAKYGDMKFDTAKFPNPKAMTDELHKMGFRVTLWVHPFVNVDTDTFANPRTRALLVRDLSGAPGLIQWWQGVAGVWDFSNPAAGAAFRARLQGLEQQHGIDGFKFDGGDVNFTPRDAQTHGHIRAVDYADLYNREATAHFPWNETRVGIYSQPLGIVQRLIDKHSVWGKENGLAAIVPEALTVSLRGFAYVMPDMVGGNQYDNDTIDEELLIRWAQASALMPLLQFSVGPWHHGERAVKLCREASDLHVKFAPYIVKLAQAAPRTGRPIMAPLWYHTPGDAETHAIFDQFMLGDDVVVAPVVTKGSQSRDIYLPAGQWRDLRAGETVEGGRWLRGYAAPLEVLPVFVRAGSKALP